MTASEVKKPRVPTPVGYAWLQRRLGLPPLQLTPEVRVGPVGALHRVSRDATLVPPRGAPADNVLEHILFALKQEGVSLYLLANALPQVPAEEMVEKFAETPNGAYIRKACYLWEQFTGQQLNVAAGQIGAGYVPMFEPDEYAVGESRRIARWRIDFNGLGPLGFCPIVRLTPEIKTWLGRDLLSQARAFARTTSQAMLDRALAWAYLSETEGSFAIEGEIPTHNKATAFANLLKHADDPAQLSEDHLVKLQNATLTNPLDMAVEFRTEQNRLQGPGRGAIAVTYVPPAPDLCAELMGRLMEFCNQPPRGLDKLIHAAVVSFGFVFLHPFMDGNGRLSRFLIHHCLGQWGELPKGFLLPVSVAMKRNERAYLEALTSFSRPARELCEVTWLNGEDYTYTWKPHADLAFRYIDMTPCVEFTLQMAHAALEEDLRRETQFLADYDSVYAVINDRFDIRGSSLSTLITMAFDNHGRLSRNRRK